MKRMFFTGFAGLMLAMQVFAQDALNLRQCIEMGIANNFDVRQRQLQAQSDEANWKQSRLNIFPDLNANAGHSFNQGRSIDPFTNSPITEAFNSSSFSIGSGVTLFNGFAIRNNIKQNSLTYQASKMELQQEKDNLTISIILAYLEVLSATDQLAQARNQASLSGQQVDRLQILDREGAIKPSDLSDLRGQFAGDQLTIINTQNSLESAKVRLAQLMNVPYNKNWSFEKIVPESFAATYENDPARIYQTALEQLAFIKAADLRQESAARAIKVARGQLLPVLDFNVNAFTRYSSVATQRILVNTTNEESKDFVLVNNVPLPVFYRTDNFDNKRIGYMDQINGNLSSSIGFNLTIPLFNSLFQRNRIKQAKITYESRQFQASTARTRLCQDIDQASINMNTASDKYKTLLDQVSAYDASFRAAGVRFQQGVGTSIDYLTAKNNLDRASINLIIAKYDFVLRSKILDYYQGKQLW